MSQLSDKASSWGPVIRETADGSFIVRNYTRIRRCSAPHCANNCVVVRVSSHETRGWCASHWPDYVGGNEMAA